MKADGIACDGLGCTASLTALQPREGWMSVHVSEFGRNCAYTRHADLCPVHAQALLDVCGPIPRRA